MYKERLIELKKRIEEYINAGGDIYAPKRQLPYYNYLADTAKIIRKETGKNVTIEDVYALCGIHFNRDYNNFTKFLAKLMPFAENGFADNIRTKSGRESSNVYTMLKSYAEKYNTNPFDFLVLMTGLKFSNCYIKANYIENLKLELLSTYPNKDITGIRWEHPQLYEKLRQLQRYLPNLRSIKAVAEFLGFTTRTMQGKYCGKTDEENVVKELAQAFPDKKITGLATNHPELYNKVIRCCRETNRTTADWCNYYGFTYATGQKQPRLSKTKVDSEKRAMMLLNLKSTALKSIAYDKNDKISVFEANLKATQMVIDKLNSDQIKYELTEKQAF